MRIREFEEKDFPSILRIEKECFGKEAYSRETFLQFWRNGEFLVAESDRILGYILYSNEGLIYSIAVKPEFQNKGVGSSLMEEALRRLKKKVKRVWLQTRVSNLRARKFFEKFGFKPLFRLENYYGKEDGILMVKDLSN